MVKVILNYNLLLNKNLEIKIYFTNVSKLKTLISNILSASQEKSIIFCAHAFLLCIRCIICICKVEKVSGKLVKVRVNSAFDDLH